MQFIEPNSSWYFFIDFINYEKELEKIGIYDNNELVVWLILHGIICVSGDIFRNKEKLTVRISIVEFDIENQYQKIIENIKILLKAINKLD